MHATISVNGGAMSKQSVMTRAWVIFRRTYNYPQISSPTSAASALHGPCGRHGLRPARPPASQRCLLP